MVTGDATRRHSVCMTSVRGSSRLVHKIALLLSIESVLAYARLIEDLVIGCMSYLHSCRCGAED